MKFEAKKLKITFLAGLFLIFVFFAWYLYDSPVLLLRIKSDSMWPVLTEGELVFINGLAKYQSNLEGRILAFYDPVQGKIIVHRALKKSGRCYLTKGDFNEEEDLFQPCPDFILGEIIKLPRSVSKFKML